MPRPVAIEPHAEEYLDSIKDVDQARFLAREIDRLADRDNFHARASDELSRLMEGRLQIGAEMTERAQRGLAKDNYRSVRNGWAAVFCGFLLQSISQFFQFLGS